MIEERETEIRSFTEYSVYTDLGERCLCRVLGDEAALEACTVRHPDAGGQCEDKTVFEVYGLPYCKTHGLEACFGCLTRLYELAADEIGAFLNPYSGDQNFEVTVHLEKGKGSFIHQSGDYSEAHAGVILGAYPYEESRVDSETLEWNPETDDGRETPPDWWLDTYWRTCDALINAWKYHAFILVDELELVRQKAAAQYSFAEKIYRERGGG